MISTKPSVHEVDAAMNLLSILELAKDAPALKAALGELRDQQVKAAAATDRALAAQGEVLAAQTALAEEQEAIARLNERYEQQLATAHKATEDASNDRAYARRAREDFDAWAAAEREKLAQREARCASIEADIAKRELEMAKGWEELQAEMDRVGAAQDAAIAFKAEYEAKLDALKQAVA